MAIATVLVMVHQRLPFTEPAANDTIIESIRVQMTYLMQNQTLKIDAEVEAELNYKPLQNMLFAAMTSYQMVKNKVILTMAGNGTTITGGAKILNKAKADVTEASFEVTKAIDGALLQMSTEDFLNKLLMEICAMAQTLGYNCPWCIPITNVIPPFIIGEDYPPVLDCPDYLNGLPIGL